MDNSKKIECVTDHVDSNAECLRRVIMTLTEAFPTIAPHLSTIVNEWQDIAKKINDDYKEKEK
jgi:hypothetical protein